MQVSEKMKKEVVELMKASEDSDLNKSYKFIDELPLKSFQKVVEILQKRQKEEEKLKAIPPSY